MPCDPRMCLVGLARQFHEIGFVRELDIDLTSQHVTVVNSTVCDSIRRPKDNDFDLFNFCPRCGKVLDVAANQVLIDASHNQETCGMCEYYREKADAEEGGGDKK